MALVKKETDAEKLRRSAALALERTGGANPALDATERAFASQMDEIFGAQFAEAIKDKIWDTANYGMFMSAQWAEQISFTASGFLSLTARVQAGNEIIDLGISMSDFIDRPDVIAAIREESFLFANKLGQSTTDAIRNSLTAGVELGESIPEMTKRLQTVFGISDDERAVNWRSKRVARTEVARAQTIGSREYWKQTGVVQAVVWDAAGDACPFCLEMDGKTVSINEVFFAEGDSMKVDFHGKEINLGFNYADVPGPPLHPSCRCALAPILSEPIGQ